MGYGDHRLQYPTAGLLLVVEFLSAIYAPSYVVTLYEAAQYAVCEPVIQRIAIRDLSRARTTTATTLYVPPPQDEPNLDTAARSVSAISEAS